MPFLARIVSIHISLTTVYVAPLRYTHSILYIIIAIDVSLLHNVNNIYTYVIYICIYILGAIQWLDILYCLKVSRNKPAGHRSQRRGAENDWVPWLGVIANQGVF